MFKALAWYEAQSSGLGERFLAEIGHTVTRIGDHSQQFPIVFNDVHRARLRRFPYALFFRVAGDAIYVIACFHGSRDPQRWQGRA